MALEDTSTSVEVKAANYPIQRKIAKHWEDFAEKAHGEISGEFNLFHVDAKVEIPILRNKLIIHGYRQLTNYWAGSASMWIKQRRIYGEHTSVFIQFNEKINYKFKIIKKPLIGLYFRIRYGNSIGLDDNYVVFLEDEEKLHIIKKTWSNSIFKHYLDHNLKVTLNKENGLLKIKIYKMLKRANELSNLLKQISEFTKRLQE